MSSGTYISAMRLDFEYTDECDQEVPAGVLHVQQPAIARIEQRIAKRIQACPICCSTVFYAHEQ